MHSNSGTTKAGNLAKKMDKVQLLIAQSATMVTDYSSISFDAAFLQRNILYFQFDSERYFREGLWKRGTFSYEDHGPGPVLTEVSEAVDYLLKLVELGGKPDPDYAARRQDIFPFDAGNSCANLYEAMLNISGNKPDAD